MKMWSMPICLKSTTSSVRDFMACSTFSSRHFKVACASPILSASPAHVLSRRRSTNEVFSTVSSSACRMRCCNLATAVFLPNWSCDMMTIVVVVLDIAEENARGWRLKSPFLKRTEYGQRYAAWIVAQSLRDIGFQPDNHRLVRQIQTLSSSDAAMILSAFLPVPTRGHRSRRRSVSASRHNPSARDRRS